MMWAYVLSAVLSVCGVSPGLSGRTVVAMTRNLKVQMSPPALCGRWYTVAPGRKINKWPPLYFWFVFGILVQKGCTCCLSVLYSRSELLGHWTAVCPLQNWLLFSFFLLNSGAAAVCMFLSKVCRNLVSYLFECFLLYLLLPTSTWETFIYRVLFRWFAEF